jgi:hypothetical protein
LAAGLRRGIIDDAAVRSQALTDKVPRSSESEEVDLDPQMAALIASTHAQLERMDLFTLLDVDINASRAVLQRAYFKRSRLFHPDRYFNRRLGAYKKQIGRAHV